jgi:hypothetical protein
MVPCVRLLSLHALLSVTSVARSFEASLLYLDALQGEVAPLRLALGYSPYGDFVS